MTNTHGAHNADTSIGRGKWLHAFWADLPLRGDIAEMAQRVDQGAHSPTGSTHTGAGLQGPAPTEQQGEDMNHNLQLAAISRRCALTHSTSI